MALYLVTSDIEADWTQWEGFVVRAPRAAAAKKLIQDKMKKDWPGFADSPERERFADAHIQIKEIVPDGETEIVLGANRGS